MKMQQSTIGTEVGASKMALQTATKRILLSGPKRLNWTILP
jgi:hypothetical protein